jgi:hypothetical protein
MLLALSGRRSVTVYTATWKFDGLCRIFIVYTWTNFRCGANYVRPGYFHSMSTRRVFHRNAPDDKTSADLTVPYWPKMFTVYGHNLYSRNRILRCGADP